jgi:hypothetical protein
MDVIYEVEDILDQFGDQIDFEYTRGMEESYDYYEEI